MFKIYLTFLATFIFGCDSIFITVEGQGTVTVSIDGSVIYPLPGCNDAGVADAPDSSYDSGPEFVESSVEIDCADLNNILSSHESATIWSDGTTQAYRYMCSDTENGTFTRTWRELLTVQSAADIALRRQELNTEIFGTSTLPTTGAHSVVPGTEYDSIQFWLPHWVGATNPISSPNGGVSYARLYHTTATPTGWLVILHGGHGNHGPDHPDLVPTRVDMLAAGHDVLMISMPGQGPNAPPNGTMAFHQNGWACEWSRRHMAYFGSSWVVPPSTCVIAMMLPVIEALNEYDDDYDHVGMIGLSGGGWTTHLAAALDERIDLSYPVAGSAPIVSRRDAEEMGDYEQSVKGYLNIANYETLYVMSASNGRKQVQVLNDQDTCCFDYTEAPWANDISHWASTIAGGEWSVWIVANNQHSILPVVRTQMLNDMATW